MLNVRDLKNLSKDVLISMVQVQEELLESKEKRIQNQAAYMAWLLDTMEENGCKPTAYEIQKFNDSLKG